MDEARVERRLAAILAADVAGYSRLMGVDEEGTLSQLKVHRKELVDPKITEHRGRIVKTTGDGMLVEFVSVVDAVRCAVDIQRGMGERNTGVPQENCIQFRVGINVGDIISDNNDIFGDGVNVAARLEALSEPGGIMVSRNVFDQVRDKLSFGFEDMGEQTVKNIARPIGVHRVSLVESAAPISVIGATATAKTEASSAERPSIAVLPFTNMSGDPEQDYFAEGMAEEIITALSRCTWLFVIARNSSFTYKGRAVDVRAIGRELGVRYVLQGSVRRGGDRIRFTGQLVEATSGEQIWADRFEGDLSDVFALQDRLTESVVSAIEPSLQFAEIERVKHKATANLNAYDHLLRAQQLENEFTEQSGEAALAHCQKALAIDPNYAPAMALAAYIYGWRRTQGWMKDAAAETAEGLALMTRALDHGKSDANVHWMCAYAGWELGLDVKRVLELCHRSLELNPNSAIALTIAGRAELLHGNYAKGKELLERSLRFNPRDPRGWLTTQGMMFSCLGEGRYDEGVVWGRKALAQNPRNTGAMRLLAANLAHLGQIDAAKQIITDNLRIDPNLTIAKFRTRRVFMHPDLWGKFSEGLRRAGLPE